MRETIFTFGPSNGIVGVLTEPDDGKARPGAPVVVASNVGLNHRVGPFRAYVDLARALAGLGYSMFRFDLSGLGDSEPRRDNLSEVERAILDVGDAMKILAERRAVTKFVQLGFCSGVDSAHAVSLQDQRVVGAVFLEGYSYRTRSFYLRRYLKRPLNPRFWRLYAQRKLSRFLPRDERGVREAGAAVEIFTREYPAREKLSGDLSTMATRGVRMLFVYCGGTGADHAYNYADQFDDTFPELVGEKNIEVEFFDKADHIYTFLAQRARLFERISRWMQTHFP
jgi:Serine aminopeptidase, S33